MQKEFKIEKRRRDVTTVNKKRNFGGNFKITMGLRAKANTATLAANNHKNKLLNGGPSNATRLKKASPIRLTTTTTTTSTTIEVARHDEPTKRDVECIAAANAAIATATFRSSSASAIWTAASCLRPRTLNVHNARETPANQTQIFIREVLNAWRAKARCNVVPADRTLELFHELSFHPSEKQISDMLQTAKLLARKGSGQLNGLTFGEFCVLAADLKRFRTSSFSPSVCERVNFLTSLQDDSSNHSRTVEKQEASGNNCSFPGAELRSTKSLSNVGDCQQQAKKDGSHVEVFLGGSCNPTTWRADVAIPALKESGISFYNPQVSDWTPDLIELEHRAKEKARVLFFVMDSETRASAGAIEVAHIAGQNCKQLVLVLHPYKPKQKILNEHISQQEYTDLLRNQLILKELVTRRGLPVLDDIPSGLQRTKEILSGIRDPPSNIASILVVVRGAFDRVSPVNDVITVEQCQRALSYLGYAQSLVKLDNLNKIIASQRESIDSLHKRSSSTKPADLENGSNSSSSFPTTRTPTIARNSCTETANGTAKSSDSGKNINFDLFCVISAYLSVLQQEIQESGCISPIKGTNVPPPPVYLTNMQGDESFAISYFASKNISRTSSNTSVPGSSDGERQNSLNDLLTRSRDSGTSSPQPQEPLKSRSAAQIGKQKTQQVLVNVESIETTTEIITTQTIHSPHAVVVPGTPMQMHPHACMHSQSTVSTEEESDSNDSVISSSSSVNSMNYNLNSEMLSFSGFDFREVYLGGSCSLRTKWRQEVAIPYLKSKGITFHLPALQESIQPSQLGLPEKVLEEINPTADNEVGSHNWGLPPIRPNIYNPALLDSSRVLLFVITNETRSLAPMTLAAHCIGLMYNVVLAVQMLPDDCEISKEKLTPAAIKDYNRGRSYLIDLATRQGVPVFNDIKAALECTVEKVRACNSRINRYD